MFIKLNLDLKSPEEEEKMLIDQELLSADLFKKMQIENLSIMVSQCNLKTMT